jgi:hypothetical protein
MKSHTLVRPAVRGGLALSLVLFVLAACSGSVSPPAPAPGGAGGAAGNPGGSIPPKPAADAAAIGGAGGGGETPADAAPPPPDGRGRARDAGGMGGMGGGAPQPVPTPNPVAGPAGPWARGVRVGLVEVTQGVFIKVGEGGNAIAAPMRNASLIEGRPMFARVHVATDPGFAARQLRTVLSIGYADGSKFEIEDAKMVAGPSNVERLESTFNFQVPADKVTPNSALVASIYETGAAMGPDPMVLPRFPAMGGADLGVKAGKMELTIVFVPDGPLMDTPERRKKLEQDVWDLYPVQKVNFKYHAPIPLMGAFSSAKGFAILRDAREADGAKPWEYYHYLTAATGAGFSGVSRGAGAGINAAASRVSITLVRGAAIDGNTNTVAHETGHANGVSHMPGCGAAGPDNAYPYKMIPGDLGVNGYSLTFNAFKSRTMWRELMSYCRPRWVSDYVWNKFETRVRTVTGFEAMAGTAMGQMMAARSLQGFASPGEHPNWGIVAGRMVDETTVVTPDRYALLRLADGRQVRMPVAVNYATDDETREFAINLTDADFTDGEVMEAEVFIDGERSMVPVGGMFRR